MEFETKFVREYRFIEEFDSDAIKPTITRRLVEDDIEIASERCFQNSDNKDSLLGGISQSIQKIEYGESDKCLNCNYKVGDYTGDVGYLLYISFKSRIRLKFIKLKLQFFKFFRKVFRPKDKASRIK